MSALREVSVILHCLEEANSTIVVQDGQSRDASGWSTLSKTVRDVDKAKIQDYKEDIDTLLVFVSIVSLFL